MGEPTKVCTKCGNEWPLPAFYLNPPSRGGYHPHCKACVSAYHKQRRVQDPEKVRAQSHAAVVRYRAKTGDARNRAVSKARAQALQRLADVCPAEFAAIYDAVLREHGLELTR